MFDVGFWELGLIAVVALLVVGPERLPKLARTAGLWLGRGRRVLSSVKAEIDREMRAEELKEIMAKNADAAGVHEIVEETRSVAEDLKRDLNAASESPGTGLDSRTRPKSTPSHRPADDEKV